PVPLATLSSIGDYLVDLHGQNEHQILLKTNIQREFLDLYAENDSILKEVARLYSHWKDLISQKESLGITESERAQKKDLYEHQIQEISKARLKEGEEEEIEKVLPQLKNGDKLGRLAEELYSHLNDAEGSLLERVGKCRKLAETIQSLGGDIQESTLLLEESASRLNAVADSVRGLKENIVYDPAKVDSLILRQDTLARLKKKYGTTIPEILAHKQKCERELAEIETLPERIQDLDRDIEKVHGLLMKKCQVLTLSRTKAAEKLSLRVKEELKELGFPSARFKIFLIPQKDETGHPHPTVSGLETIVFQFSANPGEELRPLKEVVSGGELSRVMLALKEILARLDFVPTLIFDEIDTGIGGSMGHVIGEKLKSLSRTHQTLLITHLPQIAAFAENHLLVEKKVSGQKTQVAVECLEWQDRVKEVARMLGGIREEKSDPTPASIRHASELLSKAGNSREVQFVANG
ncbi:MAG: hypothetical protein HYS58_03870, partial [Elusimicrobia bacterium]|nr:hypothetical protein [Elusimicrobiota bacterium]